MTDELAKARAERFKRESERFRLAFEGGHSNALALAVEYCRACREPLPPWVNRAVLARLKATESTDDEKLRIHVTRWEAVCELRDRRDELKLIEPTPDSPYDFRPTRAAAFKNVSEYLQGKEAQGTPEAIERSYKLVQRLIKDGWHPVF